MKFIEISHHTCTARISLKGGQLLFWQPTNTSTPVLWSTPEQLFHPEKPIRGGVPICWPWFGKTKLPSHGFVRDMVWHIVSRRDLRHYVEIVLKLSDNDFSKRHWPHPFNLTLTYQLGIRCSIEMKVDCDQPSFGALHSYFHVKNISQTVIHGVGHDYQESDNDFTEPNNKNTLKNPQSLDRIYLNPANITKIEDIALERSITLTHLNSHNLVVWNPGPEGAKNLKDMEHNAYKSMVCVETAAITAPLKSSIGVIIEVNDHNISPVTDSNEYEEQQ